MSYNREWDKGKQRSAEDPWQYQGSRGPMHPRDDEFYGDGKRRKFNNGGYDATQGYDQSYDDGAYDTGHIQGYVQDYPTDDRFQRGSGGAGYAKKRLIPSEPSPHVIFLGLDPDFTEADLQAYLNNNSCSLSKGFGFAQFTSIAHARAFVDPLFPFIQIPPPASHGASAAKAFYTALEAGVPMPPGGRRVKIDYSQSASPHERRGKGPMQSNEGMRDIGNTQVPVLLFRGLDPLSGPQAIAQAMKNAAGPGKDGAKGMRRIILIKDKVTMASWGFAFVEFVDVQFASTVLGLTMSPQIHPNGFRISDRPVAGSFAHPESFQPISDYTLKDEACMMSSLALGGVEGQWVRYWDEGSTVAVLEFEVAEPVQQPTAAAAKDKKERRRTKGDAHAQSERPAEASALPVSDKPVTLSLKGGLTHKTGSKFPVSSAFSMNEEGLPGDGNGPDDEQQKAAADDLKVFAAKKVAPLIASKKVASNINKWNQVQEVLHDVSPSATLEQAPPATASNSPVKLIAKSATPVPVEAEFEFSDVAKMTCLLCARQFKSLEQLKRHNNESDLHKASLTAIRAKMDQPKYRDRASERRVMHNQPDAPLPSEATHKAISKRKHAEGPPKPPTPPPAPVEPAKDQNNIGNRLLKMMGWQEGTGLGTDGEGRVDPIQTAIYAQGVGLGASKGKEIGKYESGYTGYVHMAQDAARERYGT
ncbi:hypothetical protein DAEQUDRAFT_752028 [Daedalea quercina L-15889]|uniref:G-patch domain-containing protein n=1 Tax=Daedalea quercina L-15889 TaxID=1314783 RepID=A0A165N9Z7_9APHY|nr:hypothetical protein DAEQUDRAFT_752028 [Daedalea quercina L-15889]